MFCKNLRNPRNSVCILESKSPYDIIMYVVMHDYYNPSHALSDAWIIYFNILSSVSITLCWNASLLMHLILGRNHGWTTRSLFPFPVLVAKCNICWTALHNIRSASCCMEIFKQSNHKATFSPCNLTAFSRSPPMAMIF